MKRSEFYKHVEEEQASGQRFGQALWNVGVRLLPSPVAATVTGTEADCFYLDYRSGTFIALLEMHNVFEE